MSVVFTTGFSSWSRCFVINSQQNQVALDVFLSFQASTNSQLTVFVSVLCCAVYLKVKVIETRRMRKKHQPKDSTTNEKCEWQREIHEQSEKNGQN